MQNIRSYLLKIWTERRTNERQTKTIYTRRNCRRSNLNRWQEKKRVKTHDYESETERTQCDYEEEIQLNSALKTKGFTKAWTLTERTGHQTLKTRSARQQRSLSTKCEGKESRHCCLLLCLSFPFGAKVPSVPGPTLPHDFHPRIFRLPRCYLIFHRPISGRTDDIVVQLEGDKRRSST